MKKALKELQDKPRGKRTPIEQCIVDATTFEEAERDGEIELMEQAADDLKAVIVELKKAKSIFNAASMGEDLRLARKHIDAALAKLDDGR